MIHAGADLRGQHIAHNPPNLVLSSNDRGATPFCHSRQYWLCQSFRFLPPGTDLHSFNVVADPQYAKCQLSSSFYYPALIRQESTATKAKLLFWLSQFLHTSRDSFTTSLSRPRIPRSSPHQVFYSPPRAKKTELVSCSFRDRCPKKKNSNSQSHCGAQPILPPLCSTESLTQAPLPQACMHPAPVFVFLPAAARRMPTIPASPSNSSSSFQPEPFHSFHSLSSQPFPFPFSLCSAPTLPASSFFPQNIAAFQSPPATAFAHGAQVFPPCPSFANTHRGAAVPPRKELTDPWHFTPVPRPSVPSPLPHARLPHGLARRLLHAVLLRCAADYRTGNIPVALAATHCPDHICRRRNHADCAAAVRAADVPQRPAAPASSTAADAAPSRDDRAQHCGASAVCLSDGSAAQPVRARCHRHRRPQQAPRQHRQHRQQPRQAQPAR